MTIQPPFINISDSEVGHVSDAESGQYIGSTLADALNPASQRLFVESSDQSSINTRVNVPDEPRNVPLG